MTDEPESRLREALTGVRDYVMGLAFMAAIFSPLWGPIVYFGITNDDTPAPSQQSVAAVPVVNTPAPAPRHYFLDLWQAASGDCHASSTASASLPGSKVSCTSNGAVGVVLADSWVSSCPQPDKSGISAVRREIDPPAEAPFYVCLWTVDEQPMYSYDSGGSDTYDTYDGGDGYEVTCADGWVSESGGKQGACSHHGGIG
jgi:hypothetical protein